MLTTIRMRTWVEVVRVAVLRAVVGHNARPTLQVEAASGSGAMLQPQPKESTAVMRQLVMVPTLTSTSALTPASLQVADLRIRSPVVHSSISRR